MPALTVPCALLLAVTSLPLPAGAMSPAAPFPVLSSPGLQRPAGAPVLPVASVSPANPVLHDIRRRLVHKQRVSFSELRQLADTGDGLAAYRLAERILRLERPDLLVDAAHYFSIAITDGRVYAIMPLVAILTNPRVEIKPSRLKHIERALVQQARSGQLRAIEALVQMYKVGAPFGAKPEEATTLMKMVVERKFDGEIALQLAVNIAANTPLSADEIQEIRRYLLIAEASDVLGTRAAAQNLLRSYPDPNPTKEAG
ncbi:hypothetical protein [Roseibium sediminicola]|uniref:Uncharacterized protein n=1 Tax=Roseibium sediminicola TaxID=2933272 RepID=A0ABT0GY40_9HYPH|nr:hypothetical protein [Roseibium sp. CAU 1639]MCK7614160.1 hypothetical protein [Roseibium sp. CAU 1639]